MKKILLKIFVGASLIGILLPSVILAEQQLPDYKVLEPLPGIGDNSGQTTNLQTYLPKAFNLTIGIAAAMAFVMITFGGIVYATSDAINKRDDGKRYIKNAVYGLLLVIGAYVILNTINPQILNFKLTLAKPQVATSTQNAIVATPMTSEQLLSDATVRGQLPSQVGAKPPCKDGQTTNCVNLNGLPKIALTGLAATQQMCKCVIQITGGTEPGHATHGPGNPIVDLRSDPALNTALGMPAYPPDGSVVTRKFDNGVHATFTFERFGGNPNGTSSGDHWHVVYN